MVAQLLEAKADPAAVNDDKESALALAAKYGHQDVVVSLLDAGVSEPETPIPARQQEIRKCRSGPLWVYSGAFFRGEGYSSVAAYSSRASNSAVPDVPGAPRPCLGKNSERRRPHSL